MRLQQTTTGAPDASRQMTSSPTCGRGIPMLVCSMPEGCPALTQPVQWVFCFLGSVNTSAGPTRPPQAFSISISPAAINRSFAPEPVSEARQSLRYGPRARSSTLSHSATAPSEHGRARCLLQQPTGCERSNSPSSLTTNAVRNFTTRPTVTSPRWWKTRIPEVSPASSLARVCLCFLAAGIVVPANHSVGDLCCQEGLGRRRESSRRLPEVLCGGAGATDTITGWILAVILHPIDHIAVPKR